MEHVVNIPFEVAIAAVKAGKLISRRFWGDNEFVFVRPEDTIDTNIVINNVKSIPQSVKDKIAAFDAKYNAPGDGVIFHKYLCLWECDNSIRNGWIPSQDDIFADDWYIVE